MNLVLCLTFEFLILDLLRRARHLSCGRINQRMSQMKLLILHLYILQGDFEAMECKLRDMIFHLLKIMEER